jgi:hypothetical protein
MQYFTVDWLDVIGGEEAVNALINGALTGHNHDDRYYTKSQIDAGYAKLSGGNTFTGNQTVNGNLNVANLSSLSVDGGLSATLQNVGGFLSIGNLFGGNGIRFRANDGTEWARFVGPTSGRLLLGSITDDLGNRLQVGGGIYSSSNISAAGNITTPSGTVSAAVVNVGGVTAATRLDAVVDSNTPRIAGFTSGTYRWDVGGGLSSCYLAHATGPVFLRGSEVQARNNGNTDFSNFSAANITASGNILASANGTQNIGSTTNYFGTLHVGSIRTAGSLILNTNGTGYGLISSGSNGFWDADTFTIRNSIGVSRATFAPTGLTLTGNITTGFLTSTPNQSSVAGTLLGSTGNGPWVRGAGVNYTISRSDSQASASVYFYNIGGETVQAVGRLGIGGIVQGPQSFLSAASDTLSLWQSNGTTPGTLNLGSITMGTPTITGNGLWTQFSTTGGLSGAIGNFGSSRMGIGLITNGGVHWNTQGNTFAAATVGGGLTFDGTSQIRSNSNGGFSVRNLDGTLSGTLEARTITTTAADHSAGQSTLILSPFNGIVTMGNSTLSFGSGVGGFVASQNVGFLFSQWTNNSVNGHEFGLFRSGVNTAVLATTQAGTTKTNLELASLTATVKVIVPQTTGSTTGVGLAGQAAGLIFQSDRVILCGTNGASRLIAADNRTQVVTGWFQVDDGGSVAAPAIRLGSDTTTGFWRPAANQVGVTIQGTDVFRWAVGGLVYCFAPVFQAYGDIMFGLSGGPRLRNSSGTLVVRNNADSADGEFRAGVITCAFRALSANPTTLDIASGLEQLVKNTTNGELRRWANDSGTMKSILYA